MLKMVQEEKKWYDNFTGILAQKFPKKQDLVQELMDLLYIEREAVYRRLRQDVIFTAHEVIKIAAEWNISLDDIVNENSCTVSFKMRKINYISPTDEDLAFLRKVINGINATKDYPSTEFMDICNKLPRQFLAGFPRLNQFYLFKWIYQYGNERDVVPYSRINISEEKTQLTAAYYQAIKSVPNTKFIFDRLLFDYLVSDIQYFTSIQLISAEEKELIKKDLTDLLDYLLEIAKRGCYPETKNKVGLYVSHLHVDTNYNYVYAAEANICFVNVFEKFEIFSFNPEMVENFRTWMNLKKRSSIQISEVDERSRIEYFSRQRELIEKL